MLVTAGLRNESDEGKSATAFLIVKYLGVGYLVYLGINMILTKSNTFDSDKQKLEKLD